MAWIFDTYSMNKGHSVLGVVTGKPLAIGGSLGREEATARGALYVIADALGEEDKGIDGLRVVVQGFGNVGRNLARLLHEQGAVVIAVSDSNGGAARAERARHSRPCWPGSRSTGRSRGTRPPTRSATTSCCCWSATCSRRARSSR